eukprot:TRINITY_DN43277_c0_g1_i1.p1 TRINITY_DN43277_c0_g1~~TRINITY_DN43277_c0_g1_i1.p1  ORF type:complete len:278 (-),score=32.44 TRINITY_DN43277_c0_g1_i1:160-993(-)
MVASLASDGEALFRCGEARWRLGDLRGAYEDFREAARLEPTNLEIWQRYEETYRAVEHLIAEEHAAQGLGVSRQDIDESPPPVFSFVETMQAYDSEDSDLEDHANTVAMQSNEDNVDVDIGMASVFSTGGDGGSGGSGGGLRRRPRSSSNSSSQRAGTSTTRVEFAISNRRTFLATQISWFAMGSMVVYYNLFKNDGFSRLEAALSFAVLVFAPYRMWTGSRRKLQVSISLNDVIKACCGMVVLACCIYHYKKYAKDKNSATPRPPCRHCHAEHGEQ